MKGLVVTANVSYAEQQTWGSDLTEAQRKIKVKYLYNKVHDAESIISMMRYLAAADEQRNPQEATATDTNETANMINLGIERLQKLVQQPFEYASTNRSDESVMAETSDSKILVEKTRYRSIGQNKDKKLCRRRHRSRSPSTSPSRSPPPYRSRSRASRSASRKLGKKDINPKNCLHCREFGNYGLAHLSPKSVPHVKCNYNKKWKVWRPEWVRKNIGVAYKEHDYCND